MSSWNLLKLELAAVLLKMLKLVVFTNFWCDRLSSKLAFQDMLLFKFNLAAILNGSYNFDQKQTRARFCT